MKAEVFEHTWLAMDLPFPCEIHAYLPRPFSVPKAKKVLVIYSEPRAGMISNEWVLEHYQLYDLIFTYDERLKHLPNVRMQSFGGTWCHGLPSKKDFTYSFLYSTGADLSYYAGYDIRKKIASGFGAPNIPGRLYLSTKRLNLSDEDRRKIVDNSATHNYSVSNIYDDKIPVLESMFHIAIENHNDRGFFTEKVIDCFRSYSVPIYWGTDNIGELFDIDGMILLDDEKSLSEVLSSLTLEDYWKRMPAMVENYKRSSDHLDMGVSQIRRVLIETFGEIGYA